ncbi:hypothetical protein L3Y34_019179 [Caenorhabditis briggsae]|uniref:Homeobox domain-containing protein n=1 Tax=Caenorhabditis briggsae TaxID=6238 RepID=A0AAE9DNH9_CAEBR|nr:hypothetical protein L3Y34_019179 [Caenorhabditis briggsae]
MSSQNVSSTSLGRRTRKAPATATSKGLNPKRRKLADSSESESEKDIHESRPRRKSAKYAIHNESDSDFDGSPIKRQSGNIRITEDSRKYDSSSSSSSDLESDSEYSDFGDETEDEQPKEPSQPSSSKRERRRKNADKNRRTKVNKTDEQTQVLLAAFNENPYPSLDQRNKLADETKLTENQINRWFGSKRWSENPMKKKTFFTVEQKEKLKQAFAVNRNPEEAIIASLVSDLQLSRTQVKQYFQLHRFKNPSKTLSRQEAEPIFLKFIRENPKFRNYKSVELRERTGWSRDEIKEFFEKYRQENEAASPLRTKNTTKDFPLPEEEAQPILLDIFAKDPAFTDYKNTELTQKIQWSYRRINHWFTRQRKLKQQQELAGFVGIMETIFQKKQFFRFRVKALEEKTGHPWKKIRNWLRMKRKVTLKSFFKKEISVLPEEMANFERLFKKYEAYTDADKIYEIGMREDVCSNDVADYFIERFRVLKELQGETKDGNVEQEEEDELLDAQNANEGDQNEPESDDEMDEAVESTDEPEEEMEDRSEDREEEEDNDAERELVDQQVTIREELLFESNRRIREEEQGVQAVLNPRETPIDEDLHGQMEGPVEQMEKSTDRCRIARQPYRLRNPDKEDQLSIYQSTDAPNQGGSKIILWSVNIDRPGSSNQSSMNSKPRQMNDRSPRDDHRVEQVLGKIFEEQQFLGREKKELRRKTGCQAKFMSEWFRKKRMAVLRSFFNKEIPALPEEMANFERIFNSYEFENAILADVIFRIETTENIYGDDFASYLCERKMITEELQQRVRDKLEGEEGDRMEEGSVDQSEPSSQIGEDEQGVQTGVPQEAVQMEFQHDQMEFDNPQEAPIDKELHTQEEEPVAVEPEIENDDIGFANLQDASHNEQLHDQQVEGPVANQQFPVNIKLEIPDVDVKYVEHLKVPVKQETQEPIENVEEEEEEDVEQLIVFDVIDLNTPQDIGSVGPVSILRVQTSFEDLQPFLGNLVGFAEIGYAREPDMVENKRSLNYLESLTLPFNCSLDYLQWSKAQVMEFFCQIVPPATIRKLVEKVPAGYRLSMFQETKKKYFEKLNRGGPIINWDQFLIICEEIEKLNRFIHRL